jgi:hypothetical protein
MGGRCFETAERASELSRDGWMDGLCLEHAGFVGKEARRDTRFARERGGIRGIVDR